MKKSLLLSILCVLICAGAYHWGGAQFEGAKMHAMEQMYARTSRLFFPQLHLYKVSKGELIYRDMEQMLLPVVSDYRSGISRETSAELVGQDEENEHLEGGTEFVSDTKADAVTDEDSAEPNVEEDTQQAAVTGAGVLGLTKKVEINRTKLQDFDYLKNNFFQVDNTTTVGSDLLDVSKLLNKDMRLSQTEKEPQILIYHTHSQEAYADSVPNDPSTSVVGLGDQLERILEDEYGFSVLHHKGQYDTAGRDGAYSRALPDLEQILQEYPSIEVVIDLHRDGVPETLHLVSEVDGRQTAQIMFFNGLSKTTAQGELSYLQNPYIEENLAFSFQLKLAAEEYFPGFSRNTYLKGYRYNLHLRPKSILVEVGAQTNTFEEAQNAMQPLAKILSMVLLGEYPQ